MNIIIVLRFDTPFPKKAVQRYDKKIKNMTFEERIFGRNLRMFGTSAFGLWDVPPFRGGELFRNFRGRRLFLRWKWCENGFLRIIFVRHSHFSLQ